MEADEVLADEDEYWHVVGLCRRGCSVCQINEENDDLPIVFEDGAGGVGRYPPDDIPQIHDGE